MFYKMTLGLRIVVFLLLKYLVIFKLLAQKIKKIKLEIVHPVFEAQDAALPSFMLVFQEQMSKSRGRKTKANFTVSTNIISCSHDFQFM